MMQLLQELKRRNVYKVAVAYLVAAFVVVQLAGLAADAFGLPAWFEPMVWVLCGLGLPIALVVAWAFELTPTGVRRTQGPGGRTSPGAGGTDAEGDRRAEDAREAGGRPAVKAFTGLAAVAAAVAGGWYLVVGGGETAPAPDLVDRSIAVLPFDNLGGTEEARPFVNGIHDDLLTRLSNISSLKVVSRTSVLPYRETQLGLPAIADSLGVAWIVEGGVQQAGDQVQVNAQLIRADEDVHRWAESYRRELTTENLFDVQSELTKKIAGSLEAELSPDERDRVERRPTEDLEAYRLYAQGRSRLDDRSRQGMTEAIGYFERALRRDSSFALAWSGLADAVLLLRQRDFEVPGSAPEPAEAARRALELESDLAEAHASLGHHRAYRGDGPGALRALERAVELRPSYHQAHHWLGLTLLVLGRPGPGREHLALSVELNPRNISARGWLARAHLATGDPEQALTVSRRTRRLYPDRFLPRLDELHTLRHMERWPELDARSREILAAPVDSNAVAWATGHLAVVELARGDTARARAMLARILSEGQVPVNRAAMHAALGDRDAAFRALGEVATWDMASTTAVRHIFRDLFAPLRDDPRWGELIRGINVAWGLSVDGSLPEDVEVSSVSTTDG